MSKTAIAVQLFELATYVHIDINSISRYPDSVSSTCAKDGYSYCNLQKTVVFLDSFGKEIDLTT
jgi:hypothetical protein